MAFSSNSKQLASASDDRTIKLWDTISGTLQQTLRYDADLYPSDSRSIAFSPNFLQVAFGPADLSIRILDIASGKVQLVLKGHSEAIGSMTFSLDSRLLASGAYDKAVKL